MLKEQLKNSQLNVSVKPKLFYTTEGGLTLQNDPNETLVPVLEWKGIMDNFRSTLSQIEDELDIKFDLNKRWFKFVNRKDLRPKSLEEAEYLKERNMEYLINSKVGDCTQNGNGTFRLRIDCTSIDIKTELQEVMAHEYGHTLGRFLKSDVIEELKANSFESLFTRYSGGSDEQVEDLHLSQPHDLAKYWRELILSHGYKEEEILSAIVGKPFKQFKSKLDIQKIITSFENQRENNLDPEIPALN